MFLGVGEYVRLESKLDRDWGLNFFVVFRG